MAVINYLYLLSSINFSCCNFISLKRGGSLEKPGGPLNRGFTVFALIFFTKALFFSMYACVRIFFSYIVNFVWKHFVLPNHNGWFLSIPVHMTKKWGEHFKICKIFSHLVINNPYVFALWCLFTTTTRIPHYSFMSCHHLNATGV